MFIDTVVCKNIVKRTSKFNHTLLSRVSTSGKNNTKMAKYYCRLKLFTSVRLCHRSICPRSWSKRQSASWFQTRNSSTPTFHRRWIWFNDPFRWECCLFFNFTVGAIENETIDQTLREWSVLFVGRDLGSHPRQMRNREKGTFLKGTTNEKRFFTRENRGFLLCKKSKAPWNH